MVDKNKEILDKYNLPRFLLNRLIDSIFVVEQKTGKILDINKAVEDKLEYSYISLINKNFIDIIVQQDFLTFLELLEKINESNKQFTLHILNSKNKSIPFSVEIDKFEYEEKEYCVIFCTDIKESTSYVSLDEYQYHLKLLVDTSRKMLDISNSTDDIYNHVGNALLEIIKVGFIIIYTIDKDQSEIQIHSSYGFEKGLLIKLKNILGFELEGTKFPLSTYYKKILKKSKLTEFLIDNDIHKEVISSDHRRKIFHLLNIDKIYGVGMYEGDTIYAGIDILLSHNSIKGKENLIELFIRHASLLINRLLLDNELVIAKEKAEQSDKLKSSFLANISHEIRTPMNAILGFSQLLRHPLLSEEKRNDYLEIIDVNGNSLLHILNDIIDISLIESGQLIVENRNFSINSLISDLYKLFSTKMKPGILLSVEKANPNAQSYINSDPNRIKQIFINILNNAVKYTYDGFIKFGYRLSEKNEIVFFVQDSGIGIPREKHKDIFKRFHQLSDDIIRSYGGNGIGLSISKEIIDLLEGRIWIESDSGSGSELCFSFPCQLSTEQTKENIEDIRIIEFDFSGITILIAEDDESNYEYLSEILYSVNSKVIWAQDGLEAITKYNEAHGEIDIILMDLKMPKMGGFDAIEIIRSINTTIPIIAQTAYAMDGDKQRCLDIGCNDYITKPIKKIFFLETIKKYIMEDK